MAANFAILCQVVLYMVVAFKNVHLTDVLFDKILYCYINICCMTTYMQIKIYYVFFGENATCNK